MSLTKTLLITSLLVLLVACSKESGNISPIVVLTVTPEPISTVTPTPSKSPASVKKAVATPVSKAIATFVPPMATSTPIPTATPVSTVAPRPIPTATSTPVDAVFWNERPPGLPGCTTDFEFSHQLANPEDVTRMFFSPAGHIEPHEHMLYWESEPLESAESASGEKRNFSRRIQLYAPTDIYRVDVGYSNRVTQDGDGYVEWGGYLYTCDGHQLMLGHIGDPSDEMLAVLAQKEPTCGLMSSYNPEPGCKWVIDTFIPSGTPIFKNSGYTGAFDFGLSLAGLTAAELQKQPGYGYSITPWRVSSGRAVCPIEYFPEPIRLEYRKRLSDNMTGELFECGPFNQDVPGTAMGFWMPSPSPEHPPADPSERSVDEWETIWLFEPNNDPSVHELTVGNNTFGLDNGGYQISTVSEGLVNRRWDSIKPGDTYCSEFIRAQDEKSELIVEKILIIRLSKDGLALTVEAINNNKCGDGPWQFQGGERTFYR